MAMETLRSKIIDLLLDREMSVSEICRVLELEPGREREVYSILFSLPKILKRKELALLMHPPQCLSCGFELSKADAKRCPRCKSQRLTEARFVIK